MARRSTLGAAALAGVLLAGCLANAPAPPGRALRAPPPAGVAPVAPAAATPPPARPEAPAQGAGVPAPTLTWADVAPRLYPMVIGPDTMGGRLPLDQLMLLPLPGGVWIAFVVDLEDRWHFVTLAEYRRLEVDGREFAVTALGNLFGGSQPPEGLAEPETGAPVLVYRVGDGYDAARILFLDVWAQAQAALGGRLILAIPDRDRLYAFSDQHPGLVARMRTITERDFATLGHPITRTWFTVGARGLEIYAP